MTGITNIPLDKLAQFEGNVRKTQTKGFIEELAANIKAHGLHQNLIVKKEGKRFAVVAGGQRLKALQLLAKAGDISPTHLVPCKVAQDDIDAGEISLAENIMRDDMHPADQFEAFRDLADKNIPSIDIAARFGKSEDHVLKLLKLARVSPVILKAYRADKLTLQQVMAFAVSDDHKAQGAVFKNLSPHNRDPRSIRDALTENEIPSTDKRVKFVTRKAYEEAGGAVRPDFFSDSVFILNAELLATLVAAKLERAAKRVTAEGWKWVEVHPDFGYEQRSRFRRVHAEPAPLAPKLAAKAEQLGQELEKFRDEWHAADDDSEEPARIGEIEQALEEIEAKRGDDVWTQEKLGIAGAVVTIDDEGKIDIERGLVRPEDMPKKEAKVTSGATSKAEADSADQGPSLSAALVESLTAQQSAALSSELLQRPDIALAAVAHAFASRLLLDVPPQNTCLQIEAEPLSLKRVEGSKAFLALETAREDWSRSLPQDSGELWTWCLAQDREVLLKLLAFCAAVTVNTVRTKGDKGESARLEHGDLLSKALTLDMKAWFTPDAENYFSRVGKPQILADIQEAKGQPPAPAWEKLKKADLAKEAERQLAGTGWMPELLRPAA